MQNQAYIILLAVPLALTAFTHIWNPIGFPNFHTDEGVYVKRAMHVLNGTGPQESAFYDHPYWGQLFLAGIFWLVGYPNSFHPLNDVHSIEMLYLFPRVLMGILAVIDTFLVYKISEYKYNRSIAFVASILFAVMPITWLTRRILLDSIQLPFLLSSILFAIYSTKNYDDHNHSNKKADTTISKKTFLFILLSGVFLGLAIFTKIPAFTMIPLVGFLVLRNANNNKNKRLKILGLWLIPVFLIPLIWPIYAIYLNQYHEWTAGVLLQMNRTSQPLILSLGDFYEKDPILLIFGIAGLTIAAIKRDLFILLWAIPLVTFLYFIGYVSLFYLIPLLPLFCIAIAVLIEQATNKIGRIVNQKIASSVIASALVIFGLISTVILITTNVPSYQFEAEEFAIKYLTEKLDNYNYSNKVTMLANPFYFWIPQYVFKVNDIYKGYEEKTPIETKKVLLIVDESFLNVMSRNIPYARVLQNLYNSTRILISVNETVDRYAMNRYPYTNLNEYTNEKQIEIRSNY